MYDSNNVFARIIRKELPAKIIFENDYILSIFDINPLAKVHALAICKGDYVTFDDLVNNGSPEQILGFSRGIAETINLLGIRESGYRLMTNAREDGRQEVPHLHVHILGGEILKMP